MIPLVLMALCPPTAILIVFTHLRLGGSLGALADLVARDGLLGTLRGVCGPVLLGTPTAWAIIGVFVAAQLVCMRLLPGRIVAGPPTPAGELPTYRANGVAAFVVTVGLFVGASCGLGLFSPAIVYDHFLEIVGALNVLAFGACLALYVKGRRAPSSRDHGTSGSALFDFYWGTELYPRVFGWDLKMLVTCRFGVMAWALIVISFAAKQWQTHGLSDSMVVAAGLQLVYLAKFYWWEPGYLRSLDIMHDRMGFYLVWGCLVWVPALYTSATLYLVDHPRHLGLPLALALAAAGVACVVITYLADAQRQRVRATGGACRAWGKPPVLIAARYTTADGETRENLLLASGWWGVARHFHYVTELLGALFWTLPAGFDHPLPYAYVVFLTVLLVHRALRDDARCAAKYGVAWDHYRRHVPYRMLPGVF